MTMIIVEELLHRLVQFASEPDVSLDDNVSKSVGEETKRINTKAMNGKRGTGSHMWMVAVLS